MGERCNRSWQCCGAVLSTFIRERVAALLVGKVFTTESTESRIFARIASHWRGRH